MDNNAVRIRPSRPMGTTLLASAIPSAIMRQNIPVTDNRPASTGIPIRFGDKVRPLPRRSIAMDKTTIQVEVSMSMKLMLSMRRDAAVLRK